MVTSISSSRARFIFRQLLLPTIFILPAACAPGIESEAQRKAEEFLQAHVSKCAESLFSKEVIQLNYQPTDAFSEFRDVSIITRPREISKAEELNGLEYQSIGALEIKAYRIADRPVGSNKKLCWSEWESANQYFNIERKKGAWSIESPLAQSSPVECEFGLRISPCEGK